MEFYMDCMKLDGTMYHWLPWKPLGLIVWMLALWQETGWKLKTLRGIYLTHDIIPIWTNEWIDGRSATPHKHLMRCNYFFLIYSIAVCLGVQRVSKRTYQWLSEHNVISCVIPDEEALKACVKISGEYMN